MRKGFTLIELMIVIIIVGVLATIGIVQYQAAVEKSRGAEAKSVIGYLRSQCAAKYMEDGNTANCNETNLNIGGSAGNIPGPALADCNTTNFFYYDVTTNTGSNFVVTAHRCSASGKTPNNSGGGTVTLTTDFSSGGDVWSTTGGY